MVLIRHMRLLNERKYDRILPDAVPGLLRIFPIVPPHKMERALGPDCLYCPGVVDDVEYRLPSLNVKRGPQEMHPRWQIST